VVDDGDNYVRIPNRHVFLMNNVVFNPEGAGSQWQHFQIGGEYAGGPSGPGAPSSNRGDDDLRMAGNVIWNGPAGHPLGIGDQSGCQAEHATCGEPFILANNALNTQQPTFADLAAGNVRPTGALAGARSVAIPDFSYGDLPSRPLVAAGATSNRIVSDRYGKARGANDPPGAALPQ